MSHRDYYHPPAYTGEDDIERDRKNAEFVKYSEMIKKARQADADDKRKRVEAQKRADGAPGDDMPGK